MFKRPLTLLDPKFKGQAAPFFDIARKVLSFQTYFCSTSVQIFLIMFEIFQKEIFRHRPLTPKRVHLGKK